MIIRPANPADAVGLAQIQVDSYRTAYVDLVPAAFLAQFIYEDQAQDWRDLLATATDQILLVAQSDEGELMGYALGRAGDTDMLDYDSELAALHVRQQNQRQGVGRALVAAVAERLWQRGCKSLWLSVLVGNPAYAFYERLGGVKLDERTVALDDNATVREARYGWPNIAELCVPANIDDWFAHVRAVLETAYTAAPDDEPWRQSGQSGPYERWELLRKPVAHCMDRDGTFLDIGCANGYLLECCLPWTAERGIRIEPYGLDYSGALVAMAKRRLPQYADRLFEGNAFTWQPPMRFDFVRTELVYVPAEKEREYIDYLRTAYLKPDGKLLIAQYGEGKDNPQEGLLPGCHPTRFILERLTELGVPVIGYKDGYEPVKGRRTRIAIVAATTSAQQAVLPIASGAAGESNPPSARSPVSRPAQSPD